MNAKQWSDLQRRLCCGAAAMLASTLVLSSVLRLFAGASPPTTNSPYMIGAVRVADIVAASDAALEGPTGEYRTRQDARPVVEQQASATGLCNRPFIDSLKDFSRSRCPIPANAVF
jgi:hypothetical protein